MTKVPVQVEKLPGGVTNHNYVLKSNGEKLVIRVAGVGTDDYINRKAEMQNAKAMSDAGIGPKIYFCEPETGFMVSEFVEGKTMTAEVLKENEKLLQAIAKVLRKCHTSDAMFANDFSPVRRIQQNIAILERKQAIPYYEEWKVVYAEFQRLAENMKTQRRELVPCHNDTLAGNFLGDEKCMRMIDWEYSGNNDLYYDLATFSMENELNEEEEKKFLDYYFEERQFEEKRFLENKFLTSFYWSVWSLLQIGYGKEKEFYYPYGEKRFDAAKTAWHRLEEV